MSAVPPRDDKGVEPDKARLLLERAREEYRRFENQAALASLTSARAGVAAGLALALSGDDPGYRIVLGRP